MTTSKIIYEYKVLATSQLPKKTPCNPQLKFHHKKFLENCKRKSNVI